MTRVSRLLLLAVLCVALCVATPRSAVADLLPADRPVEEVVDHYIAAGLDAAGISPAPPADDANLIRRTTLDLVGRIPTVAEAREFVDSADPDKRAELVDRVMASPGYVRHQATELDTTLMYGTRASIRNYLLTAVAENRAWDQVFRELLSGEEPAIPEDAEPEQKKALEAQRQAAEFLKRRVNDTDQLANEVSVLFFGVNVSCAKCHDHPLVSDWTQDHFFGMKSFFSRTFDNGGFLAERDYGEVSFKTTEGENRQAKLMFLSGAVLDEPEAKEPSDEEKKKEKERLEEFKKQKVAPPPPEFSRRKQLIDVALREGERDFFARAIVNRILHRLLGQGLVMPLDQMHAENPPSHPELLDWLARDFEAHGYDLRRLIRGVVLSDAYARSSRWEGEERPGAWLFAVGSVRPLAPQQFAASLKLAGMDPEYFSPAQGPEGVVRRLAANDNAARGLAGLFDMPQEGFQVSVSEALLFSNSDRIRNDLLSDGGDRLVGRLNQIEDARELIETATWTVLTRPSTDEEIAVLGQYLAEREDRRVEAIRQVVWALMTSSEFRFNY